MICKDCLMRHKNRLLSKAPDIIEKDHPCYFSLVDLRKMLNFHNYGSYDDGKILLTYNRFPTLIPVPNSEIGYYYKSKKNNLILKKELALFIAKRNLELLRKYFPISNDVISSILKYIVS